MATATMVALWTADPPAGGGQGEQEAATAAPGAPAAEQPQSQPQPSRRRRAAPPQPPRDDPALIRRLHHERRQRYLVECMMARRAHPPHPSVVVSVTRQLRGSAGQPDDDPGLGESFFGEGGLGCHLGYDRFGRRYGRHALRRGPHRGIRRPEAQQRLVFDGEQQQQQQQQQKQAPPPPYFLRRYQSLPPPAPAPRLLDSFAPLARWSLGLMAASAVASGRYASSGTRGPMLLGAVTTATDTGRGEREEVFGGYGSIAGGKGGGGKNKKGEEDAEPEKVVFVPRDRGFVWTVSAACQAASALLADIGGGDAAPISRGQMTTTATAAATATAAGPAAATPAALATAARTYYQANRNAMLSRGPRMAALCSGGCFTTVKRLERSTTSSALGWSSAPLASAACLQEALAQPGGGGNPAALPPSSPSPPSPARHGRSHRRRLRATCEAELKRRVQSEPLPGTAMLVLWLDPELCKDEQELAREAAKAAEEAARRRRRRQRSSRWHNRWASSSGGSLVLMSDSEDEEDEEEEDEENEWGKRGEGGGGGGGGDVQMETEVEANAKEAKAGAAAGGAGAAGASATATTAKKKAARGPFVLELFEQPPWGQGILAPPPEEPFKPQAVEEYTIKHGTALVTWATPAARPAFRVKRRRHVVLVKKGSGDGGGGGGGAPGGKGGAGGNKQKHNDEAGDDADAAAHLFRVEREQQLIELRFFISRRVADLFEKEGDSCVREAAQALVGGSLGLPQKSKVDHMHQAMAAWAGIASLE